MVRGKKGGEILDMYRNALVFSSTLADLERVHRLGRVRILAMTRSTLTGEVGLALAPLALESDVHLLPPNLPLEEGANFPFSWLILAGALGKERDIGAVLILALVLVDQAGVLEVLEVERS